jgi:hypothetical protein
MPGLLRGVARTAVVAGTATAVSNRVSRRQRGRWAGKDQQADEAQPQQQPAPAAPAPSTMDNRISQLQQLADLKAQGALTDAEFETQKRVILGS